MLTMTMHIKPRQRGIVVIASAYRTEDPGFESRQGVRFLGFYIHCSAIVKKLICIVIVCIWEKRILKKNKIQCILRFWQQHCNVHMYKDLSSGFEPVIFYSWGDDRYTMPTGSVSRIIRFGSGSE
jgi:hypothetical protein